ncbi:hypothetical protein HHL23_09455 [Chryseobacterium sp. RP-3-3]|uniref:Uncharacterized protein n=1 Tax=Chryseobacterium antibioticum TaxID=2728847 RepID=A0A7Y0AMF9_9FLAO|nr:hypothetical protein [Chryseobacterium antibioticum]NML70026.1 hypothetical protein [Chryseobacterium antibioticum]
METKEILKLATDINLCKPWQEKMKNDLSLKNLCQMYFDGDDWSMENDFPNIETLRNFKGKTEIHGLFADYIGMPNVSSKMAFFGDSDVKLNFVGFAKKQYVSVLILRHNVKAKITASDNAIVIINILDNAEVEIEAVENSRVDVFSYGNSNIKYSGDVRIHKSSFKK